VRSGTTLHTSSVNLKENMWVGKMKRFTDIIEITHAFRFIGSDVGRSDHLSVDLDHLSVTLGCLSVD